MTRSDFYDKLYLRIRDHFLYDLQHEISEALKRITIQFPTNLDTKIGAAVVYATVFSASRKEYNSLKKSAEEARYASEKFTHPHSPVYGVDESL